MRRIREFGVVIGDFLTGPNNAITDVPGVFVGHRTLVHDEPSVARTGITVVVPRENDIWSNYAYCGTHVFNGDGEMTGMAWVDESGLLGSPIAITNTHQVGMVRDALVRYSIVEKGMRGFILPVVAETYDGHLNEAERFPLTEDDLFAAMDAAQGGSVPEGNVGGGTGMICHEFKGGIGTSSRTVEVAGEIYTVGALVQANYGARDDLRVDGVPVGRLIGLDDVPSAWAGADADPAGSIIAVLATDAPLTADQCRRLARRATVGLARVGGYGHDSSGDIFIAFSTGNGLPRGEALRTVRTLDHTVITPILRAGADTVEESILNALTAAETMIGQKGRVVHELPLDLVANALQGHRD